MTTSALAITDEHRDLADSAVGQLTRLNSGGAARETLDGGSAHPAEIWTAAAGLGWNGLAVAEEHGGSGFGLSELAIVLEAQGHELCPGPFLPTVSASLVIDRCGSDSLRAALLPGLADGRTVAALGLSGSVVVGSDLVVSGESPAVLGAPDADVLVIAAGEDVVVVDARASGVTVTVADALDTTRNIGTVALRDVSVDADRVLHGAARGARTVFWILAAAEAVGVSWAALEMARDYAKVREQFGRTIGTFQAVKHHAREHVGQCGGGDGGGVGRGPQRRFGQCVVRRRGGSGASDPRADLQRGVQHSAARGCRVHLGARRAPVPAPGAHIGGVMADGADPLVEVVEAQRSGLAHGASFTLPARGGGATAPRPGKLSGGSVRCRPISSATS